MEYYRLNRGLYLDSIINTKKYFYSLFSDFVINPRILERPLICQSLQSDQTQPHIEGWLMLV